MSVHPCCLAMAVDDTALERIREEGGDPGGLRDATPWYLAADLLEEARTAGQTLCMLLAAGRPLHWAHWAEVTDIEVHDHASTRETRVRFGRSGPMHPVFEALDAVTLWPAEHQLERERREGLRQRRLHVDPTWLHAYALCETPSFLLQPTGPGPEGDQLPPSANLGPESSSSTSRPASSSPWSRIQTSLR